jgi:hypothetical protein
VRLTRVDIESFRGYNEPRSFDCLADVVIMYGPNGSGKTSFFDAVTWGLFGDIRRLRGSRDVVGNAHIRNYFNQSEGPQVSIHMTFGDRTALVARDSSSLRVVDDGIEIDGPAAEAWVADQFRRVTSLETWTLEEAERRFLSAHLLGQEEIASFLRGTNPRDRFDALASLLGVDIVRGFYTHTTQVEREAQTGIRELEARVATVDQRLEAIRVEQDRLSRGAPSGGESRTLERLSKELQATAAQATQAGAPVFLPSAESLTAEELLSAAQELRAVLESIIDAARRQMLAFQRIETGLPEAAQRRARHAEVMQELNQRRASASAADERLTALTNERDALTQRLAELRAASEAAKATADALGAFLLSALPYVHEPTCPVCEQAITPDDVAARLRDRAALVPESLRLLEDERRELELRATNLSEQAAETRASASSLREQIQALEAEQSELEQRIADWQTILAAVGLAGDPKPDDVAVQRATETAKILSGEQLAQQVDGILAQVRYLVSEDRRSRLAEEERRFRSERANATAELERAESSRTTLEGITAAAKESELDIVRRLMVEQKPLLNALYQRLRPHPVLDELDVDFGEFGQRGEVYFHAVAGNTRANVSAIFSSAQLNAVAICVFLALNISAGGAGFALLDDPIQNMDDFNVLGLLDMLRAVSEGRQVIVSTHDVQLGELMRRKLRPLRNTRRTITHEFIGYGELGPEIATEVDEFAEPPQLLPALVA